MVIEVLLKPPVSFKHGVTGEERDDMDLTCEF